jgi:hypothetical protein
MPKSGSRTIVTGKGFRIQPENIDSSRRPSDAFDNIETEISAIWIIRFLQERGTGWDPFTFEEINAFYNRMIKGEYGFNRLVDPEMVPPDLARAFAGHIDRRVPVGGGWIVLERDKKYYVTEDFVERCFKSNPKEKSA